jgi:hypothetical protein
LELEAQLLHKEAVLYLVLSLLLVVGKVRLEEVVLVVLVELHLEQIQVVVQEQ